MGQAQSSNAVMEDQSSTAPPAAEDQDNGAPAVEDPRNVSPMEALLAEATAYSDSNDENESLEVKAQKALECPCVADLRKGPCGTQFTEAFLCFMKSTAEEKGSDCVHPFVALQDCIKTNPNAFSKDILEEEDDKVVDEEVKDYSIIPPIWSKEAKSNI